MNVDCWKKLLLGNTKLNINQNKKKQCHKLSKIMSPQAKNTLHCYLDCSRLKPRLVVHNQQRCYDSYVRNAPGAGSDMT